ncbi:MAG: hypothetical protein JXR73_12640 [Candidatus Omnitrophica bacterium]|nr:hypothetical protein [Candidatus Omnitrophota bacterium]
MENQEVQARLFVVGGFLGAGKTTALTALADHFIRRRKRVAMITNDQTDGLVDSEIVRTHGIQYREISGACFCARFRDFLYAADALLQEIQPDVILAEPVGSAADLIATVIKPLRTYTQDRYKVMPLTVLADPLRIGEMLPDDQQTVAASPWPDEIRYLYDHQLREADCILMTKSDLASEREKENARRILVRRFHALRPALPILPFSAVTGAGLPEWLSHLEAIGQTGSLPLASFDRDRHAKAESALGWLNLEAQVIPENGGHDIDAAALIHGFLQRLNDIMSGAPVGHLKIFAEAAGNAIKASIVDWRLGYAMDAFESDALKPDAITRPAGSARILVNLRAIRDPNELAQQTIHALRDAASLQNSMIQITKEKALRPGKLKPTYRIGGDQ